MSEIQSQQVEEVPQKDSPKIANRRNKEERQIINEFFDSEEITSLIKTKPKGYVDEIRKLLKEKHDMEISKVAVYRRINKITKPPAKKKEYLFDVCINDGDGSKSLSACANEQIVDKKELMKLIMKHPLHTVFTIESVENDESEEN